VNGGLEELIDQEGLKVLHVCYLHISQGVVESPCMSQQCVSAGSGEEVWKLVGVKFVTMGNKVGFRDCK